jgi:HAD superfamily hydrolase (TIGR01484 family)
MSNIQLVVTDIDGTLVEIHGHKLTPAVKHAMQAVQKRGVTVVAATARPFDMARELFEGLGFKGLSIFDGGASIYDVQIGELVWKNWLSVERLRAIAGILLPHATLADFFPGYTMLAASEITLESIAEPAPYAYAIVDALALPEIQKQLQDLADLNVHVLAGKSDATSTVELQITDKNSDKFHAIHALRGIVHSTKENTLGIGDSSNDVPLLQNAGIKVAMGNAAPEIRAMADYVVASVHEDGWAEAMNRFVLT